MLDGWTPRDWPPGATLTGPRVRLERLDPARHAAPLWRAVESHDALWTFMAHGPFAGEADLRAMLAARAAITDQVTYVVVPATAEGREDEALALLSLIAIRPADGVLEVGQIVFAPALARTAAATEAIYLIARHVFEDLRYRRLEWKCDAGNVASRRAAERFGFRPEGLFRQHMVVKGRNRDTAWFAMLDRDWPARRAAFAAWLDPRNFDASGRQSALLRRSDPLQGE